MSPRMTLMLRFIQVCPAKKRPTLVIGISRAFADSSMFPVQGTSTPKTEPAAQHVFAEI
jgi:hypothetical protein